MKTLREQHSEYNYMEKNVLPFYKWLAGHIWRNLLCRLFGHKLRCETEGDAETGPITYYWCARGCGTSFKDHFGF